MHKFYFGKYPVRIVYYNGIKKILRSATKNGKQLIVLKNAGTNKEEDKQTNI